LIFGQADLLPVNVPPPERFLVTVEPYPKTVPAKNVVFRAKYLDEDERAYFREFFAQLPDLRTPPLSSIKVMCEYCL